MIDVLLGNQEQVSFRPSEFAAHYRRVRTAWKRSLPRPRRPSHTRATAAASARQTALRLTLGPVDHFCRVAGICQQQMERLHTTGVTTLATLAHVGDDGRPDGIPEATFLKLREQAWLQAQAPCHGSRHLPITATRGSVRVRALLPDPSPGDLFFDFEGNPFWDQDGSLEYLWGITNTKDEFTPSYAAQRSRIGARGTEGGSHQTRLLDDW